LKTRKTLSLGGRTHVTRGKQRLGAANHQLRSLLGQEVPDARYSLDRHVGDVVLEAGEFCASNDRIHFTDNVALAELDALGLDDEACELFLESNARRIFGLDARS
jgi:hypothetical protein